jgi:hypothetical protein
MYEGFRVNDTGATHFVMSFQGQKLFLLNGVQYHIITSHTHTFLYTYGTITPFDYSTLKVLKELGRTYLMVLPLCIFSYGSYDGLAISISFKPRKMPNRQ